MQVEQAIRERRSIRKFQDRPVEPEKLDMLIEAARLCQSSKNRQPWKFMLLNQEEKEHVAAIMRAPFEREGEQPPSRSPLYSAKIVEHAPIYLLIFKEPSGRWQTGDLLSIGAAVENICLRATELGLGSVWIRDITYTEQEIAAWAGYPELDLVCSLAVGYPDEAPEARPRKAVEEIMLSRR